MTEQIPLVSILIPVHNAERFVSATLDSALAQTHFNCEIIAIDDGSTDSSADVLGQYEGRIRWWSQDNAGQAISRNRLLAASSGTYLQFLDADDILHPEKIATQIRALADCSEAGLCLGAMGLFYKDIDEELEHYPNPVDVDPWLALILQQYPFTSAGLWRRSFLESIGCWQVGIVSGHEYNRYFEVLKRGVPIIFANEIHTWYRMPSHEKPNPRPRITTIMERIDTLDAIEAYLTDSLMLTRPRAQALAGQRLQLARKLWLVDKPRARHLAQRLTRRDVAGFAPTRELPQYYLIATALFGFFAAERLAELTRRK